MKKIFTFILVLMSLAIPSIAMAAANNVITYTSTTGTTVAVETTGWGVTLISNTYTGGVGTITFSGAITNIAEEAFDGCDNLKSVVLPSTVTSIGKSAFDDCESLMEIQVDAYDPPTVGKNAFRAVPEGCNVYVPCGRVASYKAAAGWKNFDYIQEPPSPYILKLLVKEPERGIAEIVQHNACGTKIKAVSNYGYHFLKWDDSNTDSVRSLTPSHNLTLTASFGKNKYTITTDLNNAAAGTVSGGKTVEYLDTVNVKADPNFGWRFTNWEDGNTDNPRIVVVERDSLFKAIFVPKSIVLKTVNQDVCDGSVYVDPYTSVSHTIDSSDPSSLTWKDSVRTATEDIVYTFVINPTVAPAMLTLAQLETIGAVPTLVPGTFPNTTASVTAILNHYKTADTKSLADVTSASWSMDKVACGATEHTMVLTVVCGCTTMVETFTFPVVSTTETRNVIAEACESYFWSQTSETYTTTGVYRDTVPSKAGCDSIYYVLDLKIWQPAYTLVKDTICEGDYYNGVQYFASTTLSNTLATSHGCDSVVEVKLTVWPKDTITTSATICYGDTYEWHGASYSTPGTYTFDTLTVHGCNSHRVLNLSVLPEVKDSVINKTLCEGAGSFTWNGTTYTLPGTYVDTIFTKNASLCDSLVILNLTILPKVPETFVDTTVCYGETFVWTIDGATYTLTGTQNKSVTLSSVNGCDSVVTLRLVQLPEVVTTPESATICAGETYTWNGAAYTASGTYTMTLADVNGCDSIATLNLTVLPANPELVTIDTICAGESYVWVDGVSYTVTTSKSITVTGANGCPQKHVLNLTVLPAVKPTVVKDTICADSTYLWSVGSNTYSYSVGGTYVDTLQDVNGCDSVVVLELTQLAPIAETFVDTTVCYGESFVWTINGATYTLTGTQNMSVTLSSVNGCDSVVTLRLVELPEVVTVPESATICAGETYIWNGAAYTLAGTYTMTLADVNGCDSIATLNLTVLPANPEVVTIDTICAGESYVWVDGVSYTVTTSKSITVTGANGCPEKQTLNLTVLPVIKPTIQKDTICTGESYDWTVGSNIYTYSVGGTYADTLITPQGCDSVVVLELTQLAPIAETFVDTTVCYGESFVWTIDGATYTLTGTQNMSVTLSSVNNCDSVVTLRLVELPEVVTVPESATICAGETYIWNGAAYTSAGTHTMTLSDVNGCDSIATLNLSMLPANPVTVDNATICVGETYIWTADGKPYTSAIDTTITLADVNGCDSVVNLKLTVFPAVPESITYDTICAGDTLIWQGNIYTKSVTNEIVTLTSVNGCDSVLKLNLHVLPPVADTTEYVTICYADAPYVWPLNGKAYMASQLDSTKVPVGTCERMVYLNLTVLPEVLPTLEEVTICAGDTFVWSANGQKYFEDKIVTETLVDVNGCDSVVKLDLTVLPMIPVTTNIDTICEGDAYTWTANGEVYTASIDTTITVPSVNGCDSVVNLKLTVWPEIPETIITATMCYGETYTWPENGVTYTKSATASVTYTTAHGCDSVITLNLIMLPKLAETHDTVYLCYGESYTWPANGTTYSVGGTYVDTLLDVNGCDSVVILNLIALPEIPETIITETFCYGSSYTWPVTGTSYTTDYMETVYLTSVHGCDSVVTLDLTMLPANAETVVNQAICAGDYYEWALTPGIKYTEATDTSVILSDVHGCDSIVRLHVSVHPVDTTWTVATICAGETFAWEGATYATNTTITKVLESAITHCDSVVALNLTVLPAIDTTQLYEYICAGKTTYWRGEAFNADTTVYVTEISALGCDSVVAWNLHVWPANLETEVHETICAGDSFVWNVNGQVYYDAVIASETLQDIHGCDSVVTLFLTKTTPVIVEVNEIACDSLVWNGMTYTTTGDYTYTTTGSNGCDSTTILHLTINSSARVSVPITACDAYAWVNTGETYTASGIYYDTLTCLNGCDSIVELHLTINHSTTSTEDTTICYGETYTWHGVVYATDTIVSDTLLNAVGCDSIITMHLTILPEMLQDSIDLSVCPSALPYTWYDQVLNAAGEYKYREQFAGTTCDSVEHVLNFVVLPTDTTIVTDTLCQGSVYEWNLTGLKYTETTDTSVVLSNVNGCDSVVRLQLYFQEPLETLTYDTLCAGDTLTWEGEKYYYSTGAVELIELSKTYTSVLTGCDSIVKLNLTMLAPIDTTWVYDYVCAGGSYTKNGVTYTSDTIIYTTEHSIATGCDSIVAWNFHVRPAVDTTVVYDSICIGDTLLWNGVKYADKGTYMVTIPDSYGCDSTVIMHLTINYPVEAEVTETACDSITWNGITYTTSGDYTYVTTGSNGCDSTTILHLTVNYSAHTDLYETACDSYTWINTGDTYTASGIYYDTLTCVNGCDSVVALNLTINNTTSSILDVMTCNGESYLWHDSIYTTSTVDTVILTNAMGCDSLAILHLTVMPEMQYDSISLAVCPSELPYAWYNQVLNDAGEYKYREQFAGTTCDSVEHVLNFVVLPIATSQDTIVACDSLVWNGISYTVGGDYNFVTTGSNGCDSIAYLHLIVNYTTTSTDSVIICYGEGYEWNDSIYTAAGEHMITLTNAAGCDSVAYLHLTIMPEMLFDSISLAVCPSELPYVWNGQSLTATGEYTHREQFVGFTCDSIEHVLDFVVLPIATSQDTIEACDSYTWNDSIYTVSGDYNFVTTGSNGCDSVAMLHLIIHNSVQTDLYVTECDSYTWENTGETFTTSGIYYDMQKTIYGCDSVIVLNLTINYSTVGTPEEVTICYGETYVWNDSIYTASGEYEVTLVNAVGCDSTAYLHLTILPEMEYVYEDTYVCPMELPYSWYGQELTTTGEYRAREQFSGTACDSVEHVLNFVVYEMTLPTTLTSPRAVCGNPVDVVEATGEIEAHIMSNPYYAPYLSLTWYVNNGGVWEVLTSDIVTGDMSDVVLKYVISTVCGDIESEEMVIPVEMPNPENDVEMDNMTALSKYNGRIFLFHLQEFETKFGWRPRPDQVTWYKVVGAVDVYGEVGDDIVVGTGHNYNLPDGENIVGSYYALVEQTEVDVNGCTGVYRTTILTSGVIGAAPRLVPNVVRPDESMTLKNLNPNQIHEIRVYSTTGELMETYTTEKVSEFILNANHTQGYYLVDVINENEKVTLRYLVK